MKYRLVTNEAEIRTLLSKYKYDMFNKETKYQAEVTTLNEKDIDDIIYDMKRSMFGKRVTVKEYENGLVWVSYPFDICTLISVLNETE